MKTKILLYIFAINIYGVIIAFLLLFSTTGYPGYEMIVISFTGVLTIILSIIAFFVYLNYFLKEWYNILLMILLIFLGILEGSLIKWEVVFGL